MLDGRSILITGGTGSFGRVRSGGRQCETRLGFNGRMTNIQAGWRVRNSRAFTRCLRSAGPSPISLTRCRRNCRFGCQTGAQPGTSIRSRSTTAPEQQWHAPRHSCVCATRASTSTFTTSLSTEAIKRRSPNDLARLHAAFLAEPTFPPCRGHRTDSRVRKRRDFDLLPVRQRTAL